jgi:hypothetical protein
MEDQIPDVHYEEKMDRFEIDRNPTLRRDIAYLWQHNYRTLFSCAGHIGEELNPYISYVKGTGDGSWEAGEAQARGWYKRPLEWYEQNGVDSYAYLSLGQFNGEYDDLIEKFQKEIPLVEWQQDAPLPNENGTQTQRLRRDIK